MQVTLIPCPRCKAIGIYQGHNFKPMLWKCPQCQRDFALPETINGELPTESNEPKMTTARQTTFFQAGVLNALSLMWDARQPAHLINDGESEIQRRMGFETWWKAKEYIKRTA